MKAKVCNRLLILRRRKVDRGLRVQPTPQNDRGVINTMCPEESQQSSFAVGLGPTGDTFRSALEDLSRIFNYLKPHPGLQESIVQWRRYMDSTSEEGLADEGRFIRHTYLAMVCKLLSALCLNDATHLTRDDIEGVLLGDYFEKHAGLVSFAEEDFFAWPLMEPTRQPGLDLAWRLCTELLTYDLSQVRPDTLAGLYLQIEGRDARSGATERDAENDLRNELRRQGGTLGSLFDPACGPGIYICVAVRLVRESLEGEGMSPADISSHILENVAGTDTNPLAVVVARTSYLLALGDLLPSLRGEATVPVFVADGGRPPNVVEDDNGRRRYILEVGEGKDVLGIPEALMASPGGLDYLLPFMKGKYGRSILGVLRDETSPPGNRAWGSFRQFLVTPATSRKPFALDEADTDVTMETQRVLVMLMLEGRDAPWFFILRNELQAAFLKGRRFDVVVDSRLRGQ